MFLLTVQIDGHGTLLLTMLFRLPPFLPLSSCGFQARVCPFVDQVSLKLRAYGSGFFENMALAVKETQV